MNQSNWGEERKELMDMVWNLLMLIYHCTTDPFKNGVEHMGVDEGSVRGWERVREVQNRFLELGGKI